MTERAERFASSENPTSFTGRVLFCRLVVHAHELHQLPLASYIRGFLRSCTGYAPLASSSSSFRYIHSDRRLHRKRTLAAGSGLCACVSVTARAAGSI